MYIFALNLRHFRSFDDLWVFPNKDVSVMVGPNNSGKTSVLRALALLLDPNVNLRRPGVISRFDFHNIDLERSIELYVWLKPRCKEVEREDGERELQYDESEEIKESFFDKLSEWQVETTVRLDHFGVEEHHLEKLIPVTVDPMEVQIPEHESLLAIRLRATWNSQQEAADIELGIIDQMDMEIAPLGVKQRELLGFKLLGSRRDPLRELSLTRRSVLSQMLDEDEVTLALRRLLAALDEAKQSLLEQESVRNLMGRLGRLVAPELVGALMTNLGTEFTLTFLSGDLWRLRGATSIATNVCLSPDEGTPLPLEYQGDGVQNLILLFHLIELLREEGANSIIALEEPEQNLEPSLARWVFGELCSLSRELEDDSQGLQGQVFVTTHSPALVSELRGAGSLLIFSERGFENGSGIARYEWCTISAQYLSQDSRKKLDQRRERYVNTLFARQVLIVEGPSEIGFLPVAFRHLAMGAPHENPYHLGLEVMNGDSKAEAPEHAKILKAYGRKCHLLLDYDGPDDDVEALKSRFDDSVDFVTCWPNANPLDFTTGCDLEVVLAAYIPPGILFRAIKYAYADAGHPLRENSWIEACQVISDCEIVECFPPVYGDVGWKDINLEDLGDERIQRAFLFALLHGPHSCKTAKDMRMIADVLADHDAFPEVVDELRRKVLRSMLKPEEINHDEPYLATRA